MFITTVDGDIVDRCGIHDVDDNVPRGVQHSSLTNFEFIAGVLVAVAEVVVDGVVV